METRCYPKLQKNERLLNRNLSEQTLPINYENIAFKEHLGEMINICPKAMSRLKSFVIPWIIEDMCEKYLTSVNEILQSNRRKIFFVISITLITLKL